MSYVSPTDPIEGRSPDGARVSPKWTEVCLADSTGRRDTLIVEVWRGKTSRVDDDVDGAAGDTFAGAASDSSGSTRPGRRMPRCSWSPPGCHPSTQTVTGQPTRTGAGSISSRLLVSPSAVMQAMLSRQKAAIAVAMAMVPIPAFCIEAKISGEKPAPMPATW